MSEAVRRQLLIVALSATVGLEFLQTTMLSFASASVMGHVGATPEEFTWAVTAYAIISVLVISKTGWFVERLGYRRYLIGSVLLFTLGAWACGSADTPGQLVWARAFQAIGGGALFTTSRVALQDLFTTDRPLAGKRYFYGVYVAIILALSIGTSIAQTDAWRWIFYTLVPFGLATAGLLFATLPNVGAREGPSRFHFGGLILLAFGIGLLQVFAQRVRFEGLEEMRSLYWLVGCSLIAFIVFLRHQWRHEKPLINMRALKRRTFGVGIFLYVAYYLTSNAFAYVYSIFALNLRLPSETSGHVQVLGAVASLVFVVAYYNGLAKRIRDKNWMLFLGFVVAAGVNLTLSRLSPDVGAQSLTWPMIAKGVATVLLVLPIPALTFNDLAGPSFADGYRFKNIVRQLSIAAATSAMILFMDRRLAYHQLDLASRFDPSGPAYQAFVQQLDARLMASGIGAAEAPAMRAQVLGGMIERQAALNTCSDAFYLIAFGFLAFAAVFLAYYAFRRLRPPEPPLPLQPQHQAVETAADAQ